MASINNEDIGIISMMVMWDEPLYSNMTTTASQTQISFIRIKINSPRTRPFQ